MTNDKLNIVNQTWTPMLAISITMSVLFIYIGYPIIYNILHFYGIVLFLPDIMPDNLNALLLGGGVLAAVRTAEKKYNVVDKQYETNSKFVMTVTKLNKYWRPTLAFSIVFAVFYLYFIIPIETVVFNIKNIQDIVPSFMYNKIQDLLLTGGVLAGLKATEKTLGVDDQH